MTAIDEMTGSICGDILPDDAINLIIKYALNFPTVYGWVRRETELTNLTTCFSLPAVNHQFYRVFNTIQTDWQYVLREIAGRGYIKIKETFEPQIQPLSRAFSYMAYQSLSLRTHIDTVVLHEKVTYRSPVQRLLSKGKLSLKKLRHAAYPSIKVKNDVLDSLRKYEKLQRDRQQLQKKYVTFS